MLVTNSLLSINIKIKKKNVILHAINKTVYPHFLKDLFKIQGIKLPYHSNNGVLTGSL